MTMSDSNEKKGVGAPSTYGWPLWRLSKQERGVRHTGSLGGRWQILLGDYGNLPLLVAIHTSALSTLEINARRSLVGNNTGLRCSSQFLLA